VLPAPATVLATVGILLHVSAPAQAGTPIAGGEYIMLTGSYSASTDLLYVVDLQQRRMNTSRYNPTNNRLEHADWVDLKKLFRK